MIPLDASVFAKLFLAEADRSQAETLIDHVLSRRSELIVPTFFQYEVLSIALRHSVPFQAVIALLDRFRVAAMSLEEPTAKELLKAEEIATSGHRKSGYPGLADSIYHAMAIERGGLFVTADRKHVAKTKTFGHVALLADWRPD